MWRLVFPLKYFALHNREKQRIDLWPTILLAITISAPFVFISGANFFETDGFLDKIIPLSSALTAFYIAALVAVATFSHPDLDKEITIGSIYIVEKSTDGEEKKDYLTRRQFACIIFGYLSFVSMIISVAAAVVVSISLVEIGDLIFSLNNETYFIQTWALINNLGIVAFSLLVSHMMVVTALGLYYLMDRIHDRAPVVLTKKRERPASKV